jgi:hypothetical protein
MGLGITVQKGRDRGGGGGGHGGGCVGLTAINDEGTGPKGVDCKGSCGW